MDKHSTAEEPIPTPDNRNAPVGFWRKIIDFMRRDVRTLWTPRPTKIPQSPNLETQPIGQPIDSQSEPPAEPPADPPVESLVDFGQLPYLAFQREVLDWRDNFHANVTERITALNDAFVSYTDSQLGKTGIYKHLFSDPADVILKDEFVRNVQIPLNRMLRDEEIKLNRLMRKSSSQTSDVAFDLKIPDAEFEHLHNIPFRRANRNKIVYFIGRMMLGSDGISSQLGEQAMHMARKAMEGKQAC